MNLEELNNLSTGVIAGEVATLGADTAPTVIKITPSGRVTTRDGRAYSFDPAALVSRFNADGIDLPVDLDHATARRALSGERADAVGWIKGLTARPDGTYGEVEWLKDGRAVLSARSHRYISPTFHHDANGNAAWLHSVALVTAPALAMPAVANASGAAPLKAVAQALGLDPRADEKAVLSAVAELKAKQDETLSGLVGAVSQVNAKHAQLVSQGVELKVDEAIRKGSITPALRDWAIGLCSANETSFDEFLKKIGTPLASLFTSAITPDMEARLHSGQESPLAASDLAASLCRQLGLKPGAIK